MEDKHNSSTFSEIEIVESREQISPCSMELSRFHPVDNFESQQSVKKSALRYTPDSIITSTAFYNSELVLERFRSEPFGSSKKINKANYIGWFQCQPELRKILVSWVNKICAQMSYSGRSLCLAITLLDCISSVFDKNQLESRLATLVCLCIATKLVESQEQYLPYESIFDFFQTKVEKEKIAATEYQIFAALQYRVYRPTFYDKLCFLMSQGIFTLDELKNTSRGTDFQSALKEQEKKLLNSAFALLQTPQVNVFSPAEIAAALVLLSRRQLGLVSWTSHLASRTGFCQRQLDDCVAVIEAFIARAELSNEDNVLVNEYVRWHELGQTLTSAINNRTNKEDEDLNRESLAVNAAEKQCDNPNYASDEASFSGGFGHCRPRDHYQSKRCSLKRLKQ